MRDDTIKIGDYKGIRNIKLGVVSLVVRGQRCQVMFMEHCRAKINYTFTDNRQGPICECLNFTLWVGPR